jgi:hypothetical protein
MPALPRMSSDVSTSLPATARCSTAASLSSSLFPDTSTLASAQPGAASSWPRVAAEAEASLQDGKQGGSGRQGSS